MNLISAALIFFIIALIASIAGAGAASNSAFKVGRVFLLIALLLAVLGMINGCGYAHARIVHPDGRVNEYTAYGPQAKLELCGDTHAKGESCHLTVKTGTVTAAFAEAVKASVSWIAETAASIASIFAPRLTP